MAGVHDFQTIAEAVETQDLGKAQDKITNLRAQESRNQSINGNYSNSDEYHQKNEMAEMAKARTQEQNPNYNPNQRGNEQW